MFKRQNIKNIPAPHCQVSCSGIIHNMGDLIHMRVKYFQDVNLDEFLTELASRPIQSISFNVCDTKMLYHPRTIFHLLSTFFFTRLHPYSPVLVLVILSAHVKRFSVSRMRDILEAAAIR